MYLASGAPRRGSAYVRLWRSSLSLVACPKSCHSEFRPSLGRARADQPDRLGSSQASPANFGHNSNESSSQCGVCFNVHQWRGGIDPPLVGAGPNHERKSGCIVVAGGQVVSICVRRFSRVLDVALLGGRAGHVEA